MPRLAERALGTVGHLAPKAFGLLSTTGFAAAGVVSVVAENLRTLADRDEALPDRAKQVAQNSVGAVLAGPKALSDRGRSLVGRDGDSGSRSRPASGSGTRAHTAGDRDGSKTTAKSVSPDERPDRSKAEEARDRQVAAPSPQRVTEPSDLKTPEAAEKKPAAKKKTKEKTKPAAKKSTTKKKSPKKAKPAAKKKTSQKKAEKPAAKKTSAKKASTQTAGASDSADGQDRPRSVEEQRAAEKTAKKQARAENGKKKDEQEQEVPAGVPAGVDEQLVADLQTMTVKQLRDRAAQDGVPGRSEMNKDELVVALATRETDDVPAKA